jgi:GrpB-like predicted nucleotidyltransferase (UPF0157 family)
MDDAAITLVEHDANWRQRFLEQQARLAILLRPWLAMPPEHIGSTAIAGLRAKPVIDILAPVASLADAERAIAVLERDGWLFWPGDPNRHYRMWFLRPTAAARTHHLQIVQHDHPDARALLLFREALRSDAALRDAYAALKDRLADRHRGDRNAYADAKSDFVRSVLRDAGVVPSRRPIG